MNLQHTFWLIVVLACVSLECVVLVRGVVVRVRVLIAEMESFSIVNSVMTATLIREMDVVQLVRRKVSAVTATLI